MISHKLGQTGLKASTFYSFEQTADALRDWDAHPDDYIKILIDLKGTHTHYELSGI